MGSGLIDAATSIVATMINLIGKGLTLGANATIAAVSRANFCERVNISLWRDIYTVIRDCDIHSLDYSAFNDEAIIEEKKERAMELIILTDSKILVIIS